MSDKAPVRHNWKVDEILALAELPLFELMDRARRTHLQWHSTNEVQLCSLLSIKTGGCRENCGYCSQSSHHEGGVAPAKMLTQDEVLTAAGRAKDAGATRFCMGAAWRDAKDGGAFDRVLDMVRGVKALGLETCCTLGMLTDEQARALKDAGLDAYNHNLDTSREHYSSIVTTRTYDDRLSTLRAVRRAGITVCTGGILGMGESLRDRCALLVELSSLDPHPESVPVNALVPIPGTPLGRMPRIDPLEFVRMIALARIVLPSSYVRLSAGRSELPREAQLMCLYVGANSIFYGDKLLTTENEAPDADRALLAVAGLLPKAPAEASPVP